MSIHEYAPQAPATDGFERGKEAGLGAHWKAAGMNLPAAGAWVDGWERVDGAVWNPVTYRSRGVSVEVMDDCEDTVTVYTHRPLMIDAGPYEVSWTILPPVLRVEIPDPGVLNTSPIGMRWLDLDLGPALDLVDAILAEVAGVLSKSTADVAAFGLFAAGIAPALDAFAEAVIVATKDAADPSPFREVAATLTGLAERVRDAGAEAQS